MDDKNNNNRNIQTPVKRVETKTLDQFRTFNSKEPVKSFNLNASPSVRKFDNNFRFKRTDQFVKPEDRNKVGENVQIKPTTNSFMKNRFISNKPGFENGENKFKGNNDFKFKKPETRVDQKDNRNFNQIMIENNNNNMDDTTFDVTIANLFEAGCQFGHNPKYTNSKMKIHGYIYEDKKDFKTKEEIINLDKTIDCLQSACLAIKNTTSKGGKVLWVCTRKNMSDMVKEISKKSGGYFVNSRWSPGTLTNFNTTSVTLLIKSKLEADLNNPIFTKKEISIKKNRIKNLENNYGGLQGLKALPDMVVIVGLLKDRIAYLEASKCNIPIIAITDTNTNPESVNYPIPSNDDSVKSVECILNALCKFAIGGLKTFIKFKKNYDDKSAISEKYSKPVEIQDKKELINPSLTKKEEDIIESIAETIE